MTNSIPDKPDALLTRDRTAEALTEAGFPIKAKTLATKATRGGGPPFSKFGLRVLYRWDDASGLGAGTPDRTVLQHVRTRCEGRVMSDLLELVDALIESLAAVTTTVTTTA